MVVIIFYILLTPRKVPYKDIYPNKKTTPEAGILYNLYINKSQQNNNLYNNDPTQYHEEENEFNRGLYNLIPHTVGQKTKITQLYKDVIRQLRTPKKTIKPNETFILYDNNHQNEKIALFTFLRSVAGNINANEDKLIHYIVNLFQNYKLEIPIAEFIQEIIVVAVTGNFSSEALFLYYAHVFTNCGQF